MIVRFAMIKLGGNRCSHINCYRDESSANRAEESIVVVSHDGGVAIGKVVRTRRYIKHHEQIVCTCAGPRTGG